MQQLSIPRDLATIRALIEAQSRLVNDLRKLAADCYALDRRSFVIAEGEVQRIGPDPVPANLRELLEAESMQLARLQYELANGLYACAARHSVLNGKLEVS